MRDRRSIDIIEQAAMRAYKEDYTGWVEDTANAIEQGRFQDIDRTALADEVRDLGKTERARFESALRILLQRKHAADFLIESPSLRPDLMKLLSNAHDDARIEAANETCLDIDSFPEACEWTVQQVLGEK